MGWKVTLYPFTSPGAASQVTLKLVLEGSDVCRFLGALYGDTGGDKTVTNVEYVTLCQKRKSYIRTYVVQHRSLFMMYSVKTIN